MRLSYDILPTLETEDVYIDMIIQGRRVAESRRWCDEFERLYNSCMCMQSVQRRIFVRVIKVERFESQRECVSVAGTEKGVCSDTVDISHTLTNAETYESVPMDSQESVTKFTEDVAVIWIEFLE